MKKRLTATLLSLCLLLTLLPAPVFAAGAADSGIPSAQSMVTQQNNAGGDSMATPSDAQPEECTCEKLCTGDNINEDCPVCSAEGAELDKVCVGVAPMLPATALAADGDTVYVGGVALTSSESTPVYATTDDNGEVTVQSSYNEQENWQIKWDGSTLTLNGAKIKGADSSESLSATVGIYAFSNSGDVSLNIALQGVNEIFDSSHGIWVYSSSTGAATLTITGDGSLTASGSSSGILVQSNDGDATLTIQNADVTAENSISSGDGVTVRAGSSSSASLSVDGGSLTATGTGVGSGINFLFGSWVSGSGMPSLTVSGNTIVRANGGISDNASTDIQIGEGQNSSGGIVFDGNEGTVYGSVTLQENITINEGESLTIPDGASLDTNGELTVDGGELKGNVPQSGVVYKVTEVTLSQSILTLDVGGTATLTATITPSNATNQNVTWSSDSNGIVTITPDAPDSKKATISAKGAGTTTITATAADGSGEKATCSVTVNAPTPVPVTGISLNKDSTTLTVGDTETLTATITPTNATNQNVTWESSNPSVATVDESGKVTAVASGEATITVTTEDGAKTATCTVIVHTATTITTQPQSVSVTEGQSATFNVTASGDNLRYQWQVNSGNGWSAITDATDASYIIDRTTTAMSGNQYHCIVTGDGGETTSSAATLTVNERPTIPPVIPPTVSEETIDAILDAEPGETVTVALEEGDTVLDADVFETLAEKDITLEITLDHGVSWTVNGQDIPAGVSLSDLDLGVTLNSDGIPVDVINTITGERDTVQITLAHDGDFGFTMTLTAPLGVENVGYWANLYHFDEDAERLTFETAAEIDADGAVSLSLSHASQYAIVIDDHSHAASELPFTDVRTDDWFYDPVCRVYEMGLMTGVSDTEFAPNTTTTRGMVVTASHRLEDSPTAENAGFSDVHDSDWYATAVNWAASEGIVGGFGDGTFQPNAPITREQMASILYRYAEYKGLDVSARATLDGYIDQPSAWAEDVMQWAVAEGPLTGVSEDRLRPQGPATRAQVALIFERFLENIH